MIKSIQSAFFMVIMVLLSDCTSAPTHTATPNTVPSSFTPTAIHQTSTHTPEPTANPTFSPTPIPTIEYGYLTVMQVATFDLWLQNQYPENSLTISKIVMGHPKDGIFRMVESPVRIVDSKDYAEVRGVGWSPNGKYFIYAASNDNSALGSWCINLCEGIELWITSHDGSFKKLLSSESARLSYKRISWHPDESKFITFCSRDDSELSKNLEICIVHIPSGEIERTGNFGEIAQYSPTGDSYLYNDSNDDYYLVTESSTQPLKILSSNIYFSVSDKSNFVWSPDGMFFYSIQKIGNNNALYRISLSGMSKKLVDIRNNEYIIHSISPNGAYLLMCDFSPTVEPFSDCIVYDIASATSTNASSSNDHIPPGWTPDSNLILDGNALNYLNESNKDFQLRILLPNDENWPFSNFSFISNLPK